MENNTWSKTVLSVYRFLPRVTFALDKLVETKAKNSSFLCGSSYSTNNIFELSDKLIKLTERKVSLINLKILTEKALKSINRDFARLLILKFIDGKKCGEIAEHFGICNRTVFRKLIQAVDSFTNALIKFNFNKEKMHALLDQEKWMMETYRELDKSADVTGDLDNIVEDKVYYEFRKTCYC